MSHWIKEHPEHLVAEWNRILCAYDPDITPAMIDLLYMYIDGSVVFVLLKDDRCFKIEDSAIGFWSISMCDRPNSLARYRKWAAAPPQREQLGESISGSAGKVST